MNDTGKRGDVVARVRERFRRPEPGSVRIAPTVKLPSVPKYHTAILAGLQGKPTYAGTVPAETVARRRAANRVARRSRRVNRMRGA